MTLIRYPRVLAAGDAGWTIEFGDRIAPEVNDLVLSFAQAVEGLASGSLLEVVPSYRSVTVYFDPIATEADRLEARLRAVAESVAPQAQGVRRTTEVPVLYGGQYGPDLGEVAAFAHLSVEEAVALHSSIEYRVYMLGFTPGFPYLGPVPDALAMPRLAVPRAKVPAGSVGIAGSQTGVYPLESPGGWRLIGRTPLRLYDPARPQPFLLAPGDRVRFVPMAPSRSPLVPSP